MNKNNQLSLATPSIAVPGLWDQGIKALRKRNKAPKNEQKAAVHNTVGDSLDQTRNDPVDTIIHSIPDVNEAYYK
ncbi:hypothetical protein WNY58_09125 [Neptuniibacter pectenicola]|uniref:Uncharacterized protein n=1 Tax=Neptuniibacter pectenicola TaxID=1806669 RepID=A0ABU9TT14_9GAMM